MFHSIAPPAPHPRTPWNKGKLIGQRPPLKKQEIWSIRVRLQLSGRIRDLALFNLAIDSKLRGSDLVKIRVRDISAGGTIASRAMVMQQKTHQPVQFEITEQTRNATHQSHVDLQANQKPASRSITAWSHQARKHGQVFRCRGR